MKTFNILYPYLHKHSLLLVLIAVTLLITQPLFAQQPGLIAAVRNNNTTEVKKLLEAGADPNTIDDDSDNVLMNAAMYASVECMNALLQKKANPNLKNKHGQTALMFCSHDVEKLKSLLQFGADINVRSTSGNTPLLVACVDNQNTDIVKFLLDNKADPLSINKLGETALIRAAQFSDTPTLRLLLSKGINVNAMSNYGGTALSNAILNANTVAVYCLLNNGADPNIVDSFLATGVSYAVMVNDSEIKKAILERTSNVNASDILGMTPLMWAVYNEFDRPEIIQLLLDKGAEVNAKQPDGSTALSWAIKKGNTATVALLKKYGAQ
jgi:uncharacterized protein